MTRLIIIASYGIIGCVPPVRDAIDQHVSSDDTGSWVDCDDPVTAYFDADQDGFGDDAMTTRACDLPPGHSAVGGDCNDMNASIFPDALEQCNQTDDDCDGSVDEDLEFAMWYPDEDGDGYGDDSGGVVACDAPVGSWTVVGGDCDDADRLRHPDADERLTRDDTDCNGVRDDLLETDATIRVSGLEESSEFGHSLAADNDLNGDGITDLLVGIPGSDAVAIFSGDVDDVSLELTEALAFFSSTEMGGRFGHAVSFSDDIDGDGVVDIAIGAPSHGSAAGGAGHVFLLLDAMGEDPFGDSSVLAVSAVPGEQLGSVVAQVGSHPELGVQIAAAGTSKIFGTAAVVVITAQNTASRISASITTEVGGATTGGAFGSAILGRVDINGDGLQDLLVGDPGAPCVSETDSTEACGAVYGFTAPFPSTISVGEFDRMTTGAFAGDQFGSSLANGQDWNGDGSDDFFVGSPGHASDSGQAHALQWPTASDGMDLELVSIARFVDGDGRLGSSISAVGDIDGDGSGEVAIGAPNHTAFDDESGAAFLYWGGVTDGVLTPESRILASEPHAGFASIVHGTQTVSTYDNVAIGVAAPTPATDTLASGSGSIWLFSTL